MPLDLVPRVLLGEVLAGLVFDQEVILTAELCAGQIDQGKFDLDVAGHYARPDIFELRVNTDKQNVAVESNGLS